MIGLTIVAAGTSAPELVVSVQAALQGSPGMSLGNVVGSNIFNIGFILGLTALVHPLRIHGNTVRMEWPVMLLASCMMYLLARDGLLDRLEGAFFCVCMLTFTVYAVWLGRQATTPDEQQEFSAPQTASFGRSGGPALTLNLLAVLVGIGMLAGGSTALVAGASRMARSFGVSDTIIGLTIVAAGTSTPELVTSLLAARRGNDDIAVGNVVGSSIFNLLGILGVTGVITPVPVPLEIVERDALWMLGGTALLFPLMRTHMTISRLEGLVLLVSFLAYAGVLLSAAVGAR